MPVQLSLAWDIRAVNAVWGCKSWTFHYWMGPVIYNAKINVIFGTLATSLVWLCVTQRSTDFTTSKIKLTVGYGRHQLTVHHHANRNGSRAWLLKVLRDQQSTQQFQFSTSLQNGFNMRLWTWTCEDWMAILGFKCWCYHTYYSRTCSNTNFHLA